MASATDTMASIIPVAFTAVVATKMIDMIDNRPRRRRKGGCCLL